jgi:transposase
MKPGPTARGLLVPLLERPRLQALASQQQGRYEVVRRARMIWLLCQGMGPAEVARRVGSSERSVYKWRSRWERHPAIESLYDAERPGRPAQISMKTRCQVVQLACQPAKGLTPFRTVWTQQALADALQESTGEVVSRSTVQRLLNAEGIRPHRVRQWLHSPDEAFEEKVEHICDLYLRPAPRETVILCVDEKPMQVLGRRFPTTLAADGSLRQDHEYTRHGVRHLLGALNVKTGHVHGRVVVKRDADAVKSFLAELGRIYRGKHIVIIWDNLNIHHEGPTDRWTEFNSRQGGRFEFVYTPLHASWVNQIEQWFSILQRRLLRHGVFSHPERLRQDVEGFIRWWNRHERKPFRWTFDGNFDQNQRRAA